MESVYKLLLTHFDYKPMITVAQFFQEGFTGAKMVLCKDICQLMKEK